MELKKREEIIKALECHKSGKLVECEQCPLDKAHLFNATCVQAMCDNALVLIKELIADVERVSKQCGEIIVECDERDAERLKQVGEYAAKVKELTEENEYLKQQNEIYEVLNKKLEDTCESYAWTYGTSISKELFLKKERENTAREMQKRLTDRDEFLLRADSKGRRLC